MCDILAISAGHSHTAQEYLPVFAKKAKQNMSGWGIGFFRDGQALVEKSSEQVVSGDQIHESFQRLARVIDSRIIVSHISCPRSGGRHSAHNNPFTLPFLDHLWLFVNVGKGSEIAEYQTYNEPILDSDVYAARILEFLRDQLVERTGKYPYASLFAALSDSIRKFLSEYPSSHTFFLANESILFAFSNFRRLMLLKKAYTWGDVLLVTSVGKGLSTEEWLPIEPEDTSLGKLIAIAGPDVLYCSNI
jgi:predicted glutamine amidotransferase